MNLYVDAGRSAHSSCCWYGPSVCGWHVWHGRTRAPHAAVNVWHSLGISATLATIGAGLCVATERFHAGFVGGVGELGEG